MRVVLTSERYWLGACRFNFQTSRRRRISRLVSCQQGPLRGRLWLSTRLLPTGSPPRKTVALDSSAANRVPSEEGCGSRLVCCQQGPLRGGRGLSDVRC